MHRILGLIVLFLFPAACGRDNVGAQQAAGQSSAEPGPPGTVDVPAGYPDLPESVLDGTEILEFAGLPLRMPDISMAGDYTVDQGGATLSVSLQVKGNTWELTRSHVEPGWPPDVTSYVLRRDEGLLVSADQQVFVLDSADGILVNERGVEVVPADLWILYRRPR